MALCSDQRLVSADDHMDIHVLPPTLFQERLPANLRENGPRVVDTDDGPFWRVEGRLMSPSGRKGKGLLHADEHGFRPGQPDRRASRTWTTGRRVFPRDLQPDDDADAGPGADPARGVHDRLQRLGGGLQLGISPQRLVPLASIPASTPEEARDELLRVAKLGLRGGIVSQFEGSEPIFEDSWHPFWDAAQEVGLPIHVHLDSGTATA